MNIPKYKQAIIEWHKSKEKYSSLVENSGIGIATSDKKGRLTFINDPICKMLGYTKDELIGKPFLRFLHPDDKKRMMKLFLKALIKPKRSLQLEFRLIHKNGNVVYCYSSPTVFKFKGKIIEFIATIQDITKLKKAEDLQMKNEKEVQLTLDATTDGIWKWNFVTDKLTFSPRYYTMLGYEPGEFPASFESWMNLIHPDDRKHALKVAEQYLKTKPDVYENEFRLMMKNGEYRWIHASAKVVERDRQGRAIRMIGNHEDITERKKAEQKIENLAKFPSENPFPVLRIAKDGNILYANKASRRLLSKWKSNVGDKAPKRWRLLIENALKSKKIKAEEEEEESGKIFSFAIAPVYEEGYVNLYGHDVTEHKKVEVSLKESEEKYRLLFNELRDAVYVHEVFHDKPGKFFAVNKAACKMLGYTEKEFLRMEVKDIDVPEQTKKIPAVHKKLFNNGFAMFETYHVAKNGRRIPVEINIRLFKLQGKPMVLSVARNITDRKRIERKLFESEKHYRKMFETMMQGAFYQCADGTITYVNPAALKMFGLTRDEFLGRTSLSPGWDMIYEDGSPFPSREHPSMKALKTGTPVYGIIAGVFNPRIQARVWMEINAIPEFRENERKPYQVLVTLHDITKRMKMEKALIENEKKYRELANSLPQIIYETDEKGNLIFVNQKSIDIIGYSQRDFDRGLNVIQIIAPFDRDRAKINIQKIMKGELTSGTEYFLQRKDETIFQASFYSNPIKKDNKIIGIRGFAIDITKRKKAEEREKKNIQNKLFLSETALQLNRFSTNTDIFNYIGEKLAMLTKNTYIIIAKSNEITKQYIITNHFGYVKLKEFIHKMIGRNPQGMILNYDDKRWQKKFIRGRIEKIFEEDFKSIFLPQISKDISKSVKNFINVNEIYMIPLHIEDNIFGFVSLVAHKNNIVDNIDIIELFINQASLAINRIDAEEKIKQQNIQLRRLNQIKTEFLNNTSHELRTPMTAMKGYLQMLLKKTLGDLNEQQKYAIDVILRNTKRLDNLVQDILDISQLESGHMKFILKKADVKQLIDDSVDLIIPYADLKNIKINVDLKKSIPEVIFDYDRIKQVVDNLLNNAIKFSSEGSIINLRVKKHMENVLFEVEDQGIGISKDNLKKVFEPFYQVGSGVDRVFGGTGLGLSISRGIIQAHGGKIWVNSRLAKGSTFKFSLPLQSVKDTKNRFKKGK